MDEVRRRIGALTAGSARQWGTMTVDQMVCHLADSFEIGLGTRPVPDVSNWFTRTGLRWFALHVPLRWPKGAQTLPEVDPTRKGTTPTALASDVQRLEDVLSTFMDVASRGQCGPHPLFGTISPTDWLRWGFLHTDHHLRQFGV